MLQSFCDDHRDVCINKCYLLQDGKPKTQYGTETQPGI